MDNKYNEGLNYLGVVSHVHCNVLKVRSQVKRELLALGGWRGILSPRPRSHSPLFPIR